MIVHLIDGTYELFRHFHGLRRGLGRGVGAAPGGRAAADPPSLAAVRGVLRGVLAMFEAGATHLGVATDHVIESFRNDLWPGYKTSEGVDPALLAQFQPLEEALTAMGVPVWAMVDFEADDALASAARLAAADPRVEKVDIWTADKDLAQCVRGDRVVQVDSRTGSVRDAEGVRQRFGVEPTLIPDYLALVGDPADGFPGARGIGPKTAARLLQAYGSIERLPPEILGDGESVRLFKDLATLRVDLPLFTTVDEIEWRGPRDDFAAWARRLDDDALVERSLRAARRTRSHGAGETDAV